jgi:cytochrome c5
VILITATLVIMAVLSACGSGSSQPPQATPSTGDTATAAPAFDTAALLQERCRVCHSLDRVTQSKLTSAQWDQVVTQMISKGAQLTDAEKQALVAYLAKTYGP